MIITTGFEISFGCPQPNGVCALLKKKNFLRKEKPASEAIALGLQTPNDVNKNKKNKKARAGGARALFSPAANSI